MGLTCQAFFDPVMDSMWRWLPAIDRLIRVLPEHTRGREPGQQLTVLKAPSGADWQRFDLYARRVQALEYWIDMDDRGDNIGPEVDWDSVVRYYPGDHILPNLRSLKSDQAFMGDFYSLAIRPPLRDLYLNYFNIENEATLPEDLKQCAETLERLTIVTVGWEPSVISDDISRALSCCTALDSLHVDSLLPETIRHLSQLRSITSLHFTLLRVELEATRLSFPALKDLEVRAREKTPALLVSFLDNLAAPKLQELEIYYDADEATHVSGIPTIREKDFPPATHVEAVLLVAAAFPCLICIEYSFYVHHDRLPSPSHVCTSSVLRPLLALRGLEAVKLEQVPFNLMTGDVTILAQAWPKLRALRLGDCVKQPSSSVELQDLLPLVRNCPDLEDLGLSLFIPDDWTSAVARPPFGGSRSRLKTFYINGAGVAFSARAAAFLASVFPEATLYALFDSDNSCRLLIETKNMFVEVMKSGLPLREGM
ncbi:hypothetical protein PsYK624_136990 [Phanerochaete sordida]|uniref:F-box domain-containing protein n=1 Tax=Phanerochaete sordida TaxID=48140 RepID=A0A9P3GM52_9APHY|nr:hypothetical protein PsYK624_136990 [Phanerochaete sordida]